jgi:hypothetical protein
MKYLSISLVFLLAVFGLSIEINPNSQAWQLFSGFHLAGLSAITCVTLWGYKQLPSNVKRFSFIALQFMAFRIAYFPVVVFSATVACYSEFLLQYLPLDLPIKIFPALFVSAALLFAVISYVLFLALKGKMMFFVLIIILGFPAILISFADFKDVTILPDNNWADINPLPMVTQPKANPYSLADYSSHSSIGQKMIGLAGKLLYEFIPKAPWAQAVQGTLEQEFTSNPYANSHDQLTYHYSAFLAAHKALKADY